MIKKFKDNVDFKPKGKIGVGCKAAKAYCSACKKNVHALKLDEHFYCQVCNAVLVPAQGAGEFPKMLPFFVVPVDLRGVLGDRPTSLKVIPASKSIDRTFPNCYAKWGKGSRLPLCLGDGENAVKNMPDGSKVPCACSDECSDRKNKNCKASAALLAVLPEVDIMSAYKVTIHSEQSIGNIMSTLNKLTGPDGSILRKVCELRIVEKIRKSTETPYYVIEMIPPALSITDFKAAFTLQTSEDLQIACDSAILEAGPGDDEIPTEVDVEGAAIANAAPGGTSSPVVESNVSEEVKNGRKAVREKMLTLVDGYCAPAAFEAFVLRKYNRPLDEFSEEDLRLLWRAIGKDPEIVEGVKNEMSAMLETMMANA